MNNQILEESITINSTNGKYVAINFDFKRSEIRL